jgi:hypothetical protein
MATHCKHGNARRLGICPGCANEAIKTPRDARLPKPKASSPGGFLAELLATQAALGFNGK